MPPMRLARRVCLALALLAVAEAVEQAAWPTEPQGQPQHGLQQCYTHGVGPDLWPGLELEQELDYGAHCQFRLLGLLPAVGYEVKISYPAVPPARFYLQLGTSATDADQTRPRRNLLNTEKVRFCCHNTHVLRGCHSGHLP